MWWSSAGPPTTAAHPPHLHDCVVDGDEVGEQVEVPGGEDESEKDLALSRNAYGQRGTGDNETQTPQAHMHSRTLEPELERPPECLIALNGDTLSSHCSSLRDRKHPFPLDHLGLFPSLGCDLSPSLQIKTEH